MSDDSAADERRRRFEEIFDASYEPLLAYARRRVGAGAADDVVAETFTVAWRRLGDVPPDPLPWLYGVARKAISQERRAARRRGALVRRIAHHSEPATERGTTSGPVLAALTRLSDSDREAILLVAWEGLTAEAAARAMGCSVMAFRVRLHRARRRLQGHLEQLDTDALPGTSVASEEVKST